MTACKPDCPCGKALGTRNTTGLCKWCYRRWLYKRSVKRGKVRNQRTVKTILKGLP